MAIRAKSIVITVRAIDTATNLGKTGDAANITLQVIKDGTAGASTNAVAEVSAANAPGIYKLTLTASEMTADFVAVMGKSSTAGIRIDGWQDATIRVPDADPGAASGLHINGSNSGTTTFGALTCTGSFTISDGLLVSRSSGNTSAITATGNGTGAGLLTTGGATGIGFSAVGGATSGDGMSVVATTSGHGLTATGVGTTKHGLNATGGSTSSDGIRATGGGTGAGLRAGSASASGNGVVVSNNIATASVTNAALSVMSASAGQRAVEIINSTTGATGIYLQGGNSTSGTGLLVEGGDAMSLVALANPGVGLTCAGNGSGDGLRIDSGSTGIALAVNAHNTNGHYAAVLGTMFGGAQQVIIGEMTGTGRGLVVNSNGGDAVVFSSFTGPGGAFNGNGLNISGNGTGAGVITTGGATGNGVTSLSGSSSGYGMQITTQAGNSDGLAIAGHGAGNAIGAYGGATGAGIHAESGASGGNGIYVLGATTSGIYTEGRGANKAGIEAVGNTGAASGVLMTGASAGAGLLVQGGAGGNAVSIVASGANAIDLSATTGMGINIATTGAGKHGVKIAPGGIGIYVTDGGVEFDNSSGDALTLTSTGGNGSGIKATPNGTGDGVTGSLSALTTTTRAEPGAVPAATATLAAKLDWLAMQARNKLVTDAGLGTVVVRDDGDTVDVATSTITDTGTVATRGKFV